MLEPRTHPTSLVSTCTEQERISKLSSFFLGRRSGSKHSLLYIFGVQFYHLTPSWPFTNFKIPGGGHSGHVTVVITTQHSSINGVLNVEQYRQILIYTIRCD